MQNFFKQLWQMIVESNLLNVVGAIAILVIGWLIALAASRKISAIIHKLIEAENPPESFYFILQKQFALKLLNTDRHYTSQLGLALTKEYTTKIRLPLKNTDFTPPPAVPTVFFEAKRIPSQPTTAS